MMSDSIANPPSETQGTEQKQTPKDVPKNKTEEITAILRDEILRGQYRAGERMPSERDLSARFEANRGAIREALKKLEQLGIASITPGGVRVIPVEEASLSVLGPLIDLQDFPDPNMVGNVLEVLGALISMAARTAIAKATEDELKTMQGLVDDLLTHVTDTEYQHQVWRELGTLFTEVSENLVLRLMLNGIKTQFIDRVESKPQTKFEFDLTTRTKILQQLSTAMSNHDANGVAKAIQAHFDMVNQNLQLALNTNLSTLQQSPSL